MTDAPFCAEVSKQLGEPVLGTASKDGVRFLLLEYGEAWGHDALGASDLPDGVKTRLRVAANAFERTRIGLVKPPGRERARPRIYVTGGPVRGDRVLVRDLSSYESLIDAPLEALLAGDESAATEVLDRPLVLVCTHGKRDRCCARLGVAMVEALSEEQGLFVLQASHLGGHRFAAVVLTLPDAITYGHLDASDAPGLAAAIRERRLYDPARFRGITGYDEPAQVADGTIRIARGLANDAPLSLVSITKGPRGATVRMRLGDEIIETIVGARPLPLLLRPSSCFEEPTASYTFDVSPGDAAQSPTT